MSLEASQGTGVCSCTKDCIVLLNLSVAKEHDTEMELAVGEIIQ